MKGERDYQLLARKLVYLSDIAICGAKLLMQPQIINVQNENAQ
jgi:hypothetical protein